MLDFYKGHIVPTTPVNIADHFDFLSYEEGKKLLSTWDDKKLLEDIRKRLIVKQAMDSKARTTPIHDYINLR